MALGQLISQRRLRHKACVFLDGDNDAAPGCILLPGDDAPERVVFRHLREHRWDGLWTRLSRDISTVNDACEKAMQLGDHHEWVPYAANQVMCGADGLWQIICAEWVAKTKNEDVQDILDAIEVALP
jgi:hypothetical protein